MKKLYTLLVLIPVLALSTNMFSQDERYLDEIFDDVEVESVIYSQNATVLFLPFFFEAIQIPLQMDIYTPAGDTETNRPLVMVYHTGNFLPAVTNQGISGSIVDSSVVEFCKEFARRGYVVAAPNYRTGWNPLATTQPERVLGLIQAAYRGIQDARTAIRYMRADAMVDNNHGINPNSVTAFGMGTGGYVSLGVATLDEYVEIVNTTHGPAKFLLDTDGDGLPDAPMVLEAYHGDINGENETVVPDANFPPFLPAGDTSLYTHFAGISSEINLGINVGGALGDISWVDENSPPIISVHSPFDIFAPYDDATVIVPTTGDPVIRAQGSFAVAKAQDSLGHNQMWKDATFNDATTLTAMGASAAAGHDYIEGLFPWLRPLNSFGLPEGVVLNWWDPEAIAPGQQGMGLPWNQLPHPSSTDSLPLTFHTQGLLLNEGMSAEKARGHINEIMAYIAPRACVALELPCAANFTISTEEILKDNNIVTLSPNPASHFIELKSNEEAMERVELLSVDGKLLDVINNVNDRYLRLDINAYDSGMYIAKIYFEKGLISKQIIKE